MAKLISLTVFDTSDNSVESFSFREASEELDALSNDEIKSALAFGLASKVTGVMDTVCAIMEEAKNEFMREHESDKQPDNKPDDEYKIIG